MANYLAFENLPTWTGKESTSEKLMSLLDYLYKMREGLSYSMGHLDMGNFSESYQKAQQQTIAEAVKVALDGVTKRLETMIREEKENKIVIGGDGKEIHLMGTVYINGEIYGGGV